MRTSFLSLLICSALLLLAGCQGAPGAAPSTASGSTPTSAATPATTAPSPTPTATATAPASCPTLPAAQPGQAPAAPLSLYAETSNGAFLALNASDGSVRWKAESAVVGGSVASVAVAQNVVYIVTGQGAISALNAFDGALRWCSRAGEHLLSPTRQGFSLAVDQGSVYLGGENGTLLALSASDGGQLWQARAEGGILSLAVADGQVYVSSEGVSGDTVLETLSAFNVSDGTEHWHFQPGNGVFTQPAVANGMVYVAEENPNFPGFLYALQAGDGSEVWHLQEQAGIGFSAPVVLNGVVYTVDSQGAYAFDTSTGAKRWSVQHGSLANLGPVVDTSGFYFGSVDGNTGQVTIYALNLSDGSRRWQAAPTLASLAANVSLAPASSSTGLTVFAALNGVVYLTSYASSGALNASDGQKLWSAAGKALAVG
jgi:outer membrane protein assembly factor BamB